MVGLPLVDKGEHTGLTARVATVYWSWSIWKKTGTHTNTVKKKDNIQVHFFPIMTIVEDKSASVTTGTLAGTL